MEDGRLEVGPERGGGRPAAKLALRRDTPGLLQQGLLDVLRHPFLALRSGSTSFASSAAASTLSHDANHLEV